MFRPTIYLILYDFLIHANAIHPSIKFTIELETNNSLPFLDIRIYRANNHLSFDIYRKPFAVANPPHVTSNHPWAQKMSFFYTLVYRAYRICSSPALIKQEISTLKEIAINRGYDPTIVDNAVRKYNNQNNIKLTTSLCTFKSNPDKYITLPFIPRISNKIGTMFNKFKIKVSYQPLNKMQSILSNYKNKIPDSQKSGIYSISCQCHLVYIGQTKRAFATRLKEHIAATHSSRNETIKTSAVATHSHNESHKIDFNSSKIIFPSKIHLLNIHELIHIFKNEHKLLNRKEDNHLNRFWQRLF